MTWERDSQRITARWDGESPTETAIGLGLSPRNAETLKFLVHKHLIMSHLAFRRDTSDDQLIVRFAVEVGSAEVLRMLYVLLLCRPGRSRTEGAQLLERRSAA